MRPYELSKEEKVSVALDIVSGLSLLQHLGGLSADGLDVLETLAKVSAGTEEEYPLKSFILEQLNKRLGEIEIGAPELSAIIRDPEYQRDILRLWERHRQHMVAAAIRAEAVSNAPNVERLFDHRKWSS